MEAEPVLPWGMVDVDVAPGLKVPEPEVGRIEARV